ncbi:unnamed protein product [Lathyrus oleraceus]
MGDEDFISHNHISSLLSPRHEKWKRVRLRPIGEYTSDASRAVTEKIDLLVVATREGFSVPEPRYDIQIKAIKIDKHDGRVCGVGEGVGLRLFYGSSRKGTKQPQK